MLGINAKAQLQQHEFVAMRCNVLVPHIGYMQHDKSHPVGILLSGARFTARMLLGSCSLRRERLPCEPLVGSRRLNILLGVENVIRGS